LSGSILEAMPEVKTARQRKMEDKNNLEVEVLNLIVQPRRNVWKWIQTLKL